MCFRGPKDRSAEIARAEEARRQERIQAGTAEIDKAFSSFDDGYFNNISKDYLDTYTPQLEDQFQDARRKLILSLGRNGIMTSSAGAREAAKQQEQYQRQKMHLAESGVNAARTARSNVEQNRSSLRSQLEGGAGVGSVAATAAAQAQAMTAPPVYSPLAEVFQVGTANLANGVNAQRAGYRGFSNFFSPSQSSASVVR